MKRKTFIQISATAMATPILSNFSALSLVQQEHLTNWAGNLTYGASNVFYPRTVEEVQQLIKKHSKIKGLGTRHCFNTIADSTENLLSTKELNKVVSLDAAGSKVTVEGGIKYGELAPYLHQK